MAIFRRARKHPQHRGMSPFRAGLLAFVIIAVGTYFGFTKANPFASPFKLKAVFETASNIQPRSPVRIAGVECGKVTKIESLQEGGARLEMEIKEGCLPIHKDAELKIRPRIFLEGNFFVDAKSGSPSEPTFEDGDTVPVTQTATPVQFGDVLAALQSDTREDLKTLLFEFGVKGLGGGGAQAFNRSVPFWEPAYRNSALANDATLGEEPTRDIQRLLRGQQRTFAALARDENALKGLVTNFNVTAAAFARQDAALEASIPALRDVLRVGSPALASLNNALPSLRRFARDALPGVRSSGPTIDASFPFISQVRRLFSRAELRGLAADLRTAIPRLARLNARTIPFLAQSRTLSACTNEVLLPFVNDTIPSPQGGPSGGPGELSGQKVLHQIQRSFVGLAGESRNFDANTPAFKTQGVPPANLTQVRPLRPADGGVNPPDHRPDVVCETQDPPNLHAPGGTFASLQSVIGSLPIVPDLAQLPDVQQRAAFSASPRGLNVPELLGKEALEKLLDQLLKGKDREAVERVSKLVDELKDLQKDGGLEGAARRQLETLRQGLEEGLQQNRRRLQKLGPAEQLGASVGGRR
jgi:phospholipid/cholesterol/gamma-HCH transport system substrate-binding protein